MNYVIVGLFAFLGGNLRYGVSLLFPKVNGFPIATLLVNLLGCFLFSWLVKHIMTDRDMNGSLILGVGTGFFGALTTFSSFALDTIQLFQAGNIGGAFVYLLVSIVGGLLFAYLGEAVYHPKEGGEEV